MKLGHVIIPKSGADILPAGQYMAVMYAAEKKDTKDGGSYQDSAGEMVKKGYLECKFEIDAAGTQFHGWKLVDRLSLWHPNEVTQEIALSKVARMASAMGWADPIEDTEQLLNKKLVLAVAHEESDNYGTQARIVKYLKLEQGGHPPVEEQKKETLADLEKKDDIPF
jgi:hypothetical protein